MSSGRSGIVALAGVRNDPLQQVAPALVRPEPPIEVASSCSEVIAVSQKRFDGIGRPTNAEAARRRHEFARLIASGASLSEAQRGARISLQRALDLLDPPEMRQLAARSALPRVIAA